MSMQAEARENLRELIESFSQGMLVTRSLDGELRSRPMALSEHDRSERLYFVTDRDSAKIDEIDRRPEVNVSFQSGSKYVSISGRAEVLVDRALAERIWSPPMKAWFPEGVSDPDLRIVRVTPSRAEYWDVGGVERLRFLWEAGKAILTGEEMETREDEDVHAKVEF